MKAILVIDMPEVCGVCPLCQPDNERNMCYCGKTMTDIKLAEKPDWCPLKSMPVKKSVSYHDDIYGDVEKNFTNIGWNACIDEILNDE